MVNHDGQASQGAWQWQKKSEGCGAIFYTTASVESSSAKTPVPDACRLGVPPLSQAGSLLYLSILLAGTSRFADNTNRQEATSPKRQT
jgi:hypothetical protein